jgi:hypothetical protein
MNKTTLCLAAALVIMAALCSTARAQACEAQSDSSSLCTVIPLSADVRNKPNGRVEYGVTGKVLVTGRSKNGLWARIEVPCAGYVGWIARKDLACGSMSAGANEPARP